MIVRPAAGGWQHLITQPDHAALAARIMEQSSALATAERRDRILRAIRHHDDGWREPDAAPSVDPQTGRVLDFVGVAAAIKQGVWPRCLAGLADAPWSAALVAHHAITVYHRFRGDRAWDAFFAEMEQARAAFLALDGGALEVLAGDYVHLRLGDLASLAFCNDWREAQAFGAWTVRLIGDQQLLVEPNPFVHDVPITIEARALPRTPLATDADLAGALRQAPRVTIAGVVVGRAGRTHRGV